MLCAWSREGKVQQRERHGEIRKANKAASELLHVACAVEPAPLQPFADELPAVLTDAGAKIVHAVPTAIRDILDPMEQEQVVDMDHQQEE